MGTNNSSLGKLSAHTSSKVESVWNATQHLATPEQIEAGVRDLPEEAREILCGLLTFEEIPTSNDLYLKGESVVALLQQEGVNPGDKVMVGGAPFFMEHLCHSLRASGMTPVFAFSKRESAEQAMPDGSIRKVAVFRHLGFVQP